jgi:hypothetical protein
LKQIRKRLTYANVMSTVAVFLLVGGATAFATTLLPKNSVGAKQLKKSAVNSAKVKDHSLKAVDFKEGQLPAGPKGPKGDKGDKGEKGEPGPLSTTLPSGKTLRGIYSYAGHEVTGFSPTYAISYQFPLASPPELNVIEVGDPSTPACPGDVDNPQAAPGNLCVYEQRNDSATELEVFNEISDGRFGAVLFADLADNTDYEFEGTWAVTAP